MLKILKISLLCFFCFSLVACVKNEHLIRSASLGTLTKGDSPVAAKVKINGTPSLYYQSKKRTGYSVQKFSISNGVQIDPYYLTYRNERLEYWGYAHEHKRILGPLNIVIDEVLTMEAQLQKEKTKKQTKQK